MNQEARAVYTALGLGAVGTLFLEIVGGMLGFVHLGAWQATGIAALCLILFLLAISQLDPAKPKR